MAQVSAGVLMYRRVDEAVQVLLVHPGGPFWKRKDDGAWSIPKGGVNAGEELLTAARREFLEETGFAAEGEFLPLKAIRQKSGKTVHGWAVAGEIDATRCKSNTFEMEWPLKSGKIVTFPEVDRVEWFDLGTARAKILPAQGAFLEELERVVLGK